jgi:hypothetical protein
MGAVTQRKYRERCRAGIGILSIPVDIAALSAMLEDAGLIESDCDDRQRLADALAKVVANWLGAGEAQGDPA